MTDINVTGNTLLDAHAFIQANDRNGDGILCGEQESGAVQYIVENARQSHYQEIGDLRDGINLHDLTRALPALFLSQENYPVDSYNDNLTNLAHNLTRLNATRLNFRDAASYCADISTLLSTARIRNIYPDHREVELLAASVLVSRRLNLSGVDEDPSVVRGIEWAIDRAIVHHDEASLQAIGDLHSSGTLTHSQKTLLVSTINAFSDDRKIELIDLFSQDSDPEIREQAVSYLERSSIRRVFSSRSTRILMRALCDSDPRVRKTAYDRLLLGDDGEISNRDIQDELPELLSALNAGNLTEGARVSVVEYLVRIGSVDSTNIEQSFVALLIGNEDHNRDPSPRVRALAALYLSFHHLPDEDPSRQITTALRQGLNDESIAVRLSCALSLIGYGPVTRSDRIRIRRIVRTRDLNGSDAIIAEIMGNYFVGALSTNGSQLAQVLLHPSTNIDIRRIMVSTIEEQTIYGPVHRAILPAVLGNSARRPEPDEEIRIGMVRLLIHPSEETFSILRRLLNDPSPRVRFEAIVCLATNAGLHLPNLQDVLQRLLRDPAPMVRNAAAVILAERADLTGRAPINAAYLPMIREASLNRDYGEIQARAAQLLGRRDQESFRALTLAVEVTGISVAASWATSWALRRIIERHQSTAGRVRLTSLLVHGLTCRGANDGGEDSPYTIARRAIVNLGINSLPARPLLDALRGAQSTYADGLRNLLAQRAGTGDIPLLVDLLSDPEMYGNALYILRHLPQSVPYLSTQIRDEQDPTRRATLVRYLEAINTEESRTALRQLAE
jgi:HEAT repeat protein